MANFIILTGYFEPEFTGIAVHATDLAKELAVLGHQVSVFTAMPFYPNWNIFPEYRRRLFYTENINKVKIHRNWLFVPDNKRGISTLKRMIHEISFVCLQFFNLLFHLKTINKAERIIVFSPPFLQGINSTILSLLFRKQVIFHVEDIQPDSAVDLGMIDQSGKKQRFIGILHLLERLFYLTSRQVSTLTQGMRENIESKISNSRQDVILFPYWVDFDLFLKDPNARTRFRNRFSIANEKLIVGYAGNLGKKQNLDHLMDIAASPALDKDIQFLIAGEGAEKHTLIDRTKKLQLKNVSFLPLLKDQEYVDFLNGVDLSYISQDVNADKIFIPSKLFKTLSCGSPMLCIANKNSELAKLIIAANAGFIQGFNELSETVSLLNSIAKEAKQLEIFGDKAYHFARDEYNKDKIILNFLNDIGIVANQKKREHYESASYRKLRLNWIRDRSLL